MKLRDKITWALCAFAIGTSGLATGLTLTQSAHHTKAVTKATETIFVQNNAKQFISDTTIRKDIPAWEKAANGAFRKVWGTPTVSIRLVHRLPLGQITAVFQNKGDVKGALAYHTVIDGEPRIVVYAGVGAYYGYNNSVSFTHELFELLADPTISVLQQGWPDPIVWVGTHPNLLPITVDWANEVCDPVEAYAYGGSTRISDWITPAWFNDEVNSKYFDYLGKIHAPLTIIAGGYAQFFAFGQWYAVTDFGRKGGDRGFFLGEQTQKGVTPVKGKDLTRFFRHARN